MAIAGGCRRAGVDAFGDGSLTEPRSPRRGKAAALGACALLAAGCVTSQKIAPDGRTTVSARALGDAPPPESPQVPTAGGEWWTRGTNAAWLAALEDEVTAGERSAAGAGAPQDPQPPASAPTTRPEDPEGESAISQDPRVGERAAALRARFGSSVTLRDDGRISKMYFLGGETGPLFLNLLAEPEQAPQLPQAPKRFQVVRDAPSVLSQMLGGQEVELVYFPAFEKITSSRIAERVVGTFPLAPTPPQVVVENSLVVVTASPEGLAAFEDALNLFFAFAPQVEIEVKVVEYTTSDALDFGVSPLDANTPLFNNLSSSQLVRSITANFPFGTAGGPAGSFVLGGIHDSWELNARLTALEANSLVDIISQPKLTVRNGSVASIVTTTEFPFPKAKITSSGQNITADIEFKKVGVTMNIRPVIAGTDTVILEIYADVSSVTGFADTDPVDTPIVSTRSAVTSVHVPNGSTTVIGGLTSHNRLDLEDKVPLLGDIPVLGFLFRRTSCSVSKTNLQFLITPRIKIGPRGIQR